jgi:hypothetical protein
MKLFGCENLLFFTLWLAGVEKTNPEARYVGFASEMERFVLFFALLLWHLHCGMNAVKSSASERKRERLLKIKRNYS